MITLRMTKFVFLALNFDENQTLKFIENITSGSCMSQTSAAMIMRLSIKCEKKESIPVNQFYLKVEKSAFGR